MTDETPEQHNTDDVSTEQQVKPTVTTPPSEDWESRYKGASRLINQLTVEVKDLKVQLSEKTSELERLKSDLSIKDVEKDAAVGERDKTLEQKITELNEAKRELKDLRAYKTKAEIAKKLDPRLLTIIDRIPAVEDIDAQEQIMKDFITWGDQIAKQRESQILAGVTPTNVTSADEGLPTTREEWNRQLAQTPLGPEREKLWEHYWEWAKPE